MKPPVLFLGPDGMWHHLGDDVGLIVYMLCGESMYKPNVKLAPPVHIPLSVNGTCVPCLREAQDAARATA